MKFPTIKAPVIVNVIIAAVSLFISGFGLLFGIAHIIGDEKVNPNLPQSEKLLGVFMVTLLCVLGVLFLIVAMASIRGIILRAKSK